MFNKSLCFKAACGTLLLVQHQATCGSPKPHSLSPETRNATSQNSALIIAGNCVRGRRKSQHLQYEPQGMPSLHRRNPGSIGYTAIRTSSWTRCPKKIAFSEVGVLSPRVN